jgi:hypothetical protein
MSPHLSTLLAMLEYARPHGSLVEAMFIKRFIAPLKGAYKDAHSNWHVQVGDSPVLWSSHTDTVARKQSMQTLHINKLTGIIQLSQKSSKKADCLGGDDTCGVWLMSEMIKRSVPGRYIFHFGEEVGGIGSSALAKTDSKWLEQFKFAIALDRAGHNDIITHQGCIRTASDAFAESLASQLDMDFTPSDRGVYTDTAEYVDMIPECSNVSVGYAMAHTSSEVVDMYFLDELLDKLCGVDQSTLVCARDPLAIEDFTFSRQENWWSKYVVDTDICTECGRDYLWENSTARVKTFYCSAVCENMTCKREYLDSDYQEVQDALRKQLDRKGVIN